MSTRARYRVGREVTYTPTSSEETTHGAGTYPARISRVNSDGTVDLTVDVPSAVQETGTVDGTYAQSPEGDLLDELRSREQLRHKASVSEGSGPGTFSFTAGPTSV